MLIAVNQCFVIVIFDDFASVNDVFFNKKVIVGAQINGIYLRELQKIY